MFKHYSWLLLVTFLLSAGPVHASVYDYIYPFNNPSFSNYGTLGLIQNPNARFLPEGSLAFSWSHYDPYLRGSIVAYPFDWMEASFQYADINNQLYSESKAFSGSQSLKDKSFDVKIRLTKESNSIPTIALGIRDLGGTGLFSSEYLVASKRLQKNIDFSFGIGWGNLNQNKVANPLKNISSRFEARNQDLGLGGKPSINNFFSGDAGYFAGLEYTVPNTNGIRIKIELDGTNYQTEALLPLEQDSKFNVGIVYPVTKRFQTKFSFGRGNTINFGFSYSISLGSKNPLNIKKPKRVELENSEIIKEVTGTSNDRLYRASLLYLKEEGFSLQKANISEDQLHVVFSHNTYRSPTLAAGRAIGIIDQIAPDSVKDIKVSEVNAGVGLYSASVPRDIFNRYRNFDNPDILSEYIDTEAFLFREEEYEFQPSITYPVAFNSMGPELVSQIGGPDGFFFGDLKWNIDSEFLFSRNISLVTALTQGIVDNMDELKLPSDSVLPHVRTDIVEYLKQSRGFSIKRMQLNYFKQLSSSLFYKLSGGIFESMFSGYGGEILYRPFEKNYGVGMELWKVYQREYDQLFDLRDYDTLTGHISFYYQEPRSNILFTLKGGRYLAEDSGVTLDFSRIFKSGMRMGAFFSLTDISEEEFGEGSFDKGFYFWIPVELFSPRYFKRTFGWGLRPLTRDGAQSLVYAYPLWGVTDTSNRHRLMRRIDEIYD